MASSFDSAISSSDLDSGCPPPPMDLLYRCPRSPPSSSPRFFWDGFDDVQPTYFLDACFLCRRPLAGNRDIFMYRGDLPFCSEECRQEQIEMDEGKEIRVKWKLARRLSFQPVESNRGESRPNLTKPSLPPCDGRLSLDSSYLTPAEEIKQRS